MKMRSVSVARRAALAACLLAGCPASNAAATNAYWHGGNNAGWSTGITPGTNRSNWYSVPPPTVDAPDGTARQPPTGTAIFSRGGKQHVAISEQTTISTMRFTPGAPPYSFLITEDGRLDVIGGGLINEAVSTPDFLVSGGGILAFTNAARIVSREGKKTPISVFGGRLQFHGESHGGDATVVNTEYGALAGLVSFDGLSSGGRMTINNRGDAGTQFLGRSNPGVAQLTNNADFLSSKRPIINLAPTRGAKGDHNISAGKIVNNAGKVQIGENALTVHGDFTQRSAGTLYLLAIGARAGGMNVRGSAKIDGGLAVESTGSASGVQPGRHVILRAGGALSGRFSRVDFNGFPPHLKARIAYLGTDVVLFIERR